MTPIQKAAQARLQASRPKIQDPVPPTKPKKDRSKGIHGKSKTRNTVNMRGIDIDLGA